MCALAVHAYGLITKNAIELERTDYFSDTTDPTILMAYELGIVSGYPDGTFRPDKPLTRQEFSRSFRTSAMPLRIILRLTARICPNSRTSASFRAGLSRQPRSA